MTKYYFNENEKHLVRLMAQGLQDGSVEATWIVHRGGDKILSAPGSGKVLWREIREGRLQIAEFDNFAASGLFIRSGNNYTLRRQQIIDAVNNDFEPPINLELEPEQRDLLFALVEASRNVSPKQDFHAGYEPGLIGVIVHPGFNGGQRDASLSDLQIFRSVGLLIFHNHDPLDIYFSVTPLSFSFYKQLKNKMGQPIDRVVSTIRSYFDAREFQQKYPAAYAKWVDAESRLWGADAETQLTTIGHLCREAMQEFATTLVEKFQPPNFSADKAHTKNRVGEVIKLKGAELGETEKPFLDALFDYWDKLIPMVQRQEHGGQREKGSLVWEDGRRVVFQTAIVMFEIDRAVSRQKQEGV